MATSVKSGRPVAKPPKFDVERIRAEFPALSLKVHGKPLVYLDNAATSQKPRSVIEATDRYYAEQNANVHRGVYYLSEQATELYEVTRKKARAYLNAAHDREIIFTKGTTDSINLVASSFGRSKLKAGDEVLISAMEHHSNIVPWQLVCEQTGAKLTVIPMSRAGELLIDELPRLFSSRTRIVAVNHVSNSLGTINPVGDIIDFAHARGIPVLLDGAQAMAHMRVDVKALDADFYACSAHKMFGPTGVGILYGKERLLDAMPPYQGGGDMIRSVSFEKTTYAPLPNKFEAGTPNIAGVVGLGAALDWLAALPWDQVAEHEAALLRHAANALTAVPGITVIGTARHKASVLGFVLDGVHSHDIGTIVDQEGVAVRSGHHCTQPVMDFFGIPATTRASFALYNTTADADALVAAVRKVQKVFA